MSGLRAIAVDWSGAKQGDGKTGIAIAEAANGKLANLTTNIGRTEAVDFLISEKQRDRRLIVGLDFAFSLPAWFLHQRGLSDATELWSLAADEGETWLRDCSPPFWSAATGKKPSFGADQPEVRATDLDDRISKLAGSRPKSAFQVSGPGSVGASTLRGLPHLLRLRAAGFNIWPWDMAEPPVVIEVWPRIAIGPTVKTSAEARVDAILNRGNQFDRRLALLAASSDHAFDAAFTALWLDEHQVQIAGAASVTGGAASEEGLIWAPATRTGD